MYCRKLTLALGQTFNQFVILIVLSCLLASIAPTQSRADNNFNGQQLKFLTWSDYIDPEVVSEFEKRFNAKIKFSFFESDQSRTEMLATTNGQGYDLILVSGVNLRQYKNHGWLAQLNAFDIQNRKHIDPRWEAEFKGDVGYGVPYFWGTMGIAYRRDLVPFPITSWRQLLNLSPELSGKVIMNKDARELISIALLALGYSSNSSDSGQLRQARELLVTQVPNVKKYSSVSLTEKSALVTGDAWASMIYNGDVLMLQEHNDQIVYVQPAEGSLLWVDYLSIAASSKQKEMAAAFINYLNEPKVAARLANYVYYATPNVAAKSLLSKDYFSNSVIFPTQEQLNRMAFSTELKPRARKFINSLMVNLLNTHQAQRN